MSRLSSSSFAPLSNSKRNAISNGGESARRHRSRSLGCCSSRCGGRSGGTRGRSRAKNSHRQNQIILRPLRVVCSQSVTRSLASSVIQTQRSDRQSARDATTHSRPPRHRKRMIFAFCVRVCLHVGICLALRLRHLSYVQPNEVGCCHPLSGHE